MAMQTSRQVRELTTREHLGYVGLLILIGGSALLLLYAAQGMLTHPFRGGMDATIYAESGFRLNNPNLYEYDPIIPTRTSDFVTIFYALLPDNWESLDNVEATYVTLGVVSGLLFGVGVYLFIYEVFCRQDIAFLTALVALLVNRGLMQTPAGWGARLITPRYTVLGISPLLVWLYWRWRRGWKVTFVFASLGGLLLMHPRFSVYPATLLGIGLLFQEKPSVRYWSHVAVRVTPFIPFLLIILWLAFARLGLQGVSGNDGVSVELSPYNFPTGLLRQLFFSSIDAVVPIGLGLLGWFSRRNNHRARYDEQEAFLTFSLVPILVYAVFWLMIQWLPVFKQLNIKRFLTWAYLVPYAWGVYWLIERWQLGSLKWRLVAVVGLVALLTVTYGGIRSTLLENNVAYRQLVDWVYDRFASSELQEGHEVILADAAQADDIEEDWQSFHALCDWARVNTDVDAVFIIPPRNFSLFRLYSQRSLYTMARNVNIGSLYASEGDLVWERYEAATAAYTSGTLGAFQELSTLGRADYIVVERDKFTLSVPSVYDNRRYLVYELSSLP
jgi:hypothetical protein